MLELLIVIACLALNAVFSSYEMAFITIREEELEGFHEGQRQLRQKLSVFKRRPERTLSAIQIGITLVGAIAAAVGGTGAVENLEPYLVSDVGLSHALAEIVAVAVVIVPLTYFSVVFGELVPKTIGLRYPEKVLSLGTGTVYLIDKLLSPIVSFLERSTAFILKALNLDKEEDDEIPETVDIGKLPAYHRDFVHNLVNLRSRRIKAIMIPWDDVSSLKFSDTDGEVLARLEKEHRSRFPVTDGDVLVGMFHAKEWEEPEGKTSLPWQSNLGPAFTVSPDERVLDAFLRMQSGNHHLAVVAIDDKHFMGVISIEDIVEQILGNIKDDLERNKITRLLSHRTKITLKGEPR